MKRFVLLMSAVVLLSSCSETEVIPMHGRLIFTPPYAIAELGLATRSDRILLETDYPGQTITSLGMNRFLVGQERGASSMLRLYDVHTNTFTDVVNGERPHFVAKHRGFYYFSGRHLFFANLENPVASARTIAEVPSSYVHVIPVSDDEVVFQTRGDAGATPPVLFNLVTGSLDRLPLTRKCTPYIWRTASQQLLCGVAGSTEYYLTDLDGQRSSQVSFSAITHKSPRPLLYLPQFDVLILGVARFALVGLAPSERQELWAYAFQDGRAERLTESRAPGRGGIVWVDEAPRHAQALDDDMRLANPSPRAPHVVSVPKGDDALDRGVLEEAGMQIYRQDEISR